VNQSKQSDQKWRTSRWSKICYKIIIPPQKAMPPINPTPSSAVDPRSPMAPPYIDDDDDLLLVQQGLDTAENETRDAVADAYEASARFSDDPNETLNDIDFTEAEDLSTTPELAAIHIEYLPSDEHEHFPRRHASSMPN
jgi:hypothetical protein